MEDDLRAKDDAVDIVAMPRTEPKLSLWRLAARDPQEPPFHFSNTPSALIIAAESAEHARNLAALSELGGAAWFDDARTSAEPMEPRVAMIIARDFG